MSVRNSHLPVSRATNAYDLLSEIVNLILDEPLRYNQMDWRIEGSWLQRLAAAGHYQIPVCGTVGCVAGWVSVLKNLRVRNFGFIASVQPVLGLTDDQAEDLFAGSAVTSLLEDMQGADATPPRKQTPEYALLGALHIRLFQDQYADQLKAKAV